VANSLHQYLKNVKTRHSSVARSMQTFIITVKIEPDNDDERRLLIEAFDHEATSFEKLVNVHIVDYVKITFPGMKFIRADHEKYPTLLKVYLKSSSQN
jgi:hypothetical protein